jgi:hypothetical protein
MAQDKMYLTVDKQKRQPENDGYIAVISLGQPQLGDQEVTILGIKVVKDRKEAEAWFERAKIEQPWELRS